MLKLLGIIFRLKVTTDGLFRRSSVKKYFILNGYGAWSNRITDKWVFDNRFLTVGIGEIRKDYDFGDHIFNGERTSPLFITIDKDFNVKKIEYKDYGDRSSRAERYKLKRYIKSRLNKKLVINKKSNMYNDAKRIFDDYAGVHKHPIGNEQEYKV